LYDIPAENGVLLAKALPAPCRPAQKHRSNRTGGLKREAGREQKALQKDLILKVEIYEKAFNPLEESDASAVAGY
jgi:hypothetical protein